MSPSDIQWFGHAPRLDRASRTLRFYGERGEGDDAETVNVAVKWEALEQLEGRQTEVRDVERYPQIFETHRSRLEAIAARLAAEERPLQAGYLVIAPGDL